MKSLICYNIILQHITYSALLQGEQIDTDDFFTLVQAGWHNGDIVCYIDGDWRDYSPYQLKCMCREILLPIIEEEINPFGGELYALGR